MLRACHEHIARHYFSHAKLLAHGGRWRISVFGKENGQKMSPLTGLGILIGFFTTKMSHLLRRWQLPIERSTACVPAPLGAQYL